MATSNPAQQMITFETTSDEGAERVVDAITEAFSALAEQSPDGVRLTYWRVPGSRRFRALMELSGSGDNPLAAIEAAGRMRQVIADHATGGGPTPEPVVAVGSYGFDPVGS